MASALVVPSAPSRPQSEALSRNHHEIAEKILKAWAWLQTRKAARLEARRLHLIEKVPLGEKSFVAVLQVDDQQFLVASGPTGVALLASLDGTKSLSNVLKEIPSTQKPTSRPRARKTKGTAA